MKKLSLSLIGLVAIILVVVVACDKNEDVTPKSSIESLSKKKPVSGGGLTGQAYLDSLYGACNMIQTDSGLIYPVVTLNNLQIIHRSIGGHDAIQITWDPLVTPGKTVAGYYFAAGPCDGRPDCGYHNNQKFSQVTTNTTGTIIVVQFGMSWLWSSNYYGCIHVLYTDNCMAMSQTFNFTGPQY